METERKLLRLRAVLHRLGIGKTMLYRLIKDEGFPPPLHIGSCSCWDSWEVNKWIDNRCETSATYGRETEVSAAAKPTPYKPTIGA